MLTIVIETKSLEWQYPREPQKDEDSHAKQFEDSKRNWGSWGGSVGSVETLDMFPESQKSINNHSSGPDFGNDGANDSSPNWPGNWQSPPTKMEGSWVLDGAGDASWGSSRSPWRNSDGWDDEKLPSLPISPVPSKGGKARQAVRSFKALAVKYLRPASPSGSIKC